MDEVKLSIIIVNWNAAGFLRKCLDSLGASALPTAHEIIVIDNASTDDSPNIAREFPHVRYVQNIANAGFARGNNQAVEMAGGEYICLLNPDVVISDPTVFSRWIAFMDVHGEAAASGCKLVFPDGSHQVGDAGFCPGFRSAVNYALFLSKFFPRRVKSLFVTSGTLVKEMEVDWVCGAGLMVRRSILSRTGLLDESIFMYAEDVEWGCRMRSYGYKVYYLPFLRIVHYQGASTKTTQIGRAVSSLWLLNMRRLYLRLHPVQPAFFYDAVMSFGFLLRAALYYMASLRACNGAAKGKSYDMFQYFLFSAKFIGGHGDNIASGGV